MFFYRSPFFVFVFICNISPAQETISFTQIAMKEGLSVGTINCIFQDSRGFMWFGTGDGLNKYDGYSITVYKNQPENPFSISNNAIRCIAEDNNGFLWLGTYSGGLNRFDPATEKFTSWQHDKNDSNSISHNIIRSLVFDEKGKLWIGTDGGGLCCFDIEKNKFRSWKNTTGKQHNIWSNHLRDMAFDKNSNLWIAVFGAGITKFNPENEHFVTFPLSEENNQNTCRALVIDEDGIIWCGTDGGGLIRFDPTTESQTIFTHDEKNNFSLPDNRVWALCDDGNGKLWLGTNGSGMAALDKKSGKFINYKHNPDVRESLADNVIYSIFKDRSGVLWFGTLSGGISLFDPKTRKFPHFKNSGKQSPQFSSNKIMSVFCENEKIWWLGTFDGGINRYDSETGEVRIFRYEPKNENSISHNNIYVIFKDNENKIWAGTETAGLNHIDLKTGKIKRFRHEQGSANSLASDGVRTITDFDDKHLLLGTTRGLSLLNKETGQCKNFLQKYLISDILIKSKNEYWLATNGGICLFNVEKNSSDFLKISETGSLENRITCLLENDGKIWAGTAGAGFLLFNPADKTFQKWNTQNSKLPNDVVYGILNDEEKNLWLSTNNGLVKFSPGKSPQSGKGEFRIYTEEEGLQGMEFNQGAYFKLADGRLLFGGMNGFNVFLPSEIKDDTVVPQMILTGFSLFNKEVNISSDSAKTVLKKHISFADTIILSWRDYVFTFSYAALHFSSSEKNRYAYKMEGFDPDWNEVGNRRFATYTNMPHGEYIFRVKGCNADGVWSSKEATITVIITPPFWRTTWFYFLSVLTMAISVIGYIKYREHKLKKRNEELEQKVDERTSQLKAEKQVSDDLLHNILPHETAEELKKTGTAKAKMYEEVTVLFTDFKGFTSVAEKLSAQELVKEINECFSAFDRICDTYKIEKIKTIGDAYMAAGGLPVENKTHAEDMVNAALEMRNFMKNKTFEIRIGIHTGNVVAGIVGIKKFQYDIWGDTVNTASRMESSGEAGKVNISESTYQLVKEKFRCEFRGEIEAKGKGKVKMYFIEK